MILIYRRYKKNHLNAKTEFDENIVYILAIKQLFVKSTKLYYIVYVQVYSVSVFLQDMKRQYYFMDI